MRHFGYLAVFGILLTSWPANGARMFLSQEGYSIDDSSSGVGPRGGSESRPFASLSSSRQPMMEEFGHSHDDHHRQSASHQHQQHHPRMHDDGEDHLTHGPRDHQDGQSEGGNEGSVSRYMFTPGREEEAFTNIGMAGQGQNEDAPEEAEHSSFPRSHQFEESPESSHFSSGPPSHGMRHEHGLGADFGPSDDMSAQHGGSNDDESSSSHFEQQHPSGHSGSDNFGFPSEEAQFNSEREGDSHGPEQGFSHETRLAHHPQSHHRQHHSGPRHESADEADFIRHTDNKMRSHMSHDDSDRENLIDATRSMRHSPDFDDTGFGRDSFSSHGPSHGGMHSSTPWSTPMLAQGSGAHGEGPNGGAFGMPGGLGISSGVSDLDAATIGSRSHKLGIRPTKMGGHGFPMGGTPFRKFRPMTMALRPREHGPSGPMGHEMPMMQSHLSPRKMRFGPSIPSLAMGQSQMHPDMTPFANGPHSFAPKMPHHLLAGSGNHESFSFGGAMNHGSPHGGAFANNPMAMSHALGGLMNQHGPRGNPWHK